MQPKMGSQRAQRSLADGHLLEVFDEAAVANARTGAAIAFGGMLISGCGAPPAMPDMSQPPAPQQYPLTVIKQGDSSNVVTSTPQGIDCGPTCAAEFSQGSVVLVAKPAPNQKFDGWSGDCAGQDLACQVSLTKPSVVTAVFEAISMPTPPPKETFPIAVTKQGHGNGVVMSAPSGINCGPTCTAVLPKGPVILTAQPGSATTFNGWSGDCKGTALTCVVTVDHAIAVTANFQGSCPAGLSDKLDINGTGWVQFNLPPGDPGQILLRHDGHWEWGICHTIWWSNVTFACNDGRWQLSHMDKASDGYCNESFYDHQEVAGLGSD